MKSTSNKPPKSKGSDADYSTAHIKTLRDGKISAYDPTKTPAPFRGKK